MEPRELVNFESNINKHRSLLGLVLFHLDEVGVKFKNLTDAKKKLAKASNLIKEAENLIDESYLYILLVDKYSNFKISKENLMEELSKIKL